MKPTTESEPTKGRRSMDNDRTQSPQNYRPSPQQARWLELQRRDGDAGSRVRCVLRVEGRLDIERARAAWGAVLAAHPALRTTVRPSEDGTAPVLEVHANGDLGWTIGAGGDAGDGLRVAWMADDPVDDGHGRLDVSAPAHAVDSWALRRLVEDWGRIYGGGEVDKRLDPAAVAAWANELLEGAETAEGRRFWSDRRPSDSLEQLPMGRLEAPGPREPRHAHKRLPAAVGRALFAKAGGGRPEAWVAACWLALVERHCGVETLDLAWVAAGRSADELYSVITPRERYLPWTASLEARGSVAALARSLESSVEELEDFQDFHTPADPPAIAFRALPAAPKLTLDGGHAVVVEEEGGVDRVGLLLTCVLDPEGPRLTLAWDAGSCVEGAGDALLEQLAAAVQAATDDPTMPPGVLPLVDEAERSRVLETLAGRDAATPLESTLHALFERRVDEHPEVLAVTGGGVSWTYAALDARANRLAHHLRGIGVGPDMRVGLCLDRSPDLITSILAVMKAGGGFVPLDPAYPAERLSYILGDAQVSVLVTSEATRDELPTHWAFEVCIDDDDEFFPGDSPERPAVALDAGNLAYVIYTSGSTGQPKGVEVPHGGVVNLAQVLRGHFTDGEAPLDGAPGAGARVLQFASLSFDTSVYEVFGALHAGATLHIESREVLQPGAPLYDYVEAQGITHLTLPPSALAALSESLPETGGLPELRVVVVAGEACPADLVSRWQPGRRFINSYGPTEGTVCATEAECLADGRRPPIGQPIANARVYVLDRRGEVQPVGVPGQLMIGGAGVARGYLGRPALTAERFIPDPYSGQGGARMYATGDLAAWRGDGSLDFLGRVDHQVKIRGVRIELGEVESVLTQHPSVREAVAIAWESAPGDKRLVAYVVATEGAEELTSETLRKYLGDRLPETMMPSMFVQLSAMPLTPNRKIDRKALPAPDAVDHGLTVAYEPPQTPTEEALCDLFAEVLHRERVGRADNFFDLGGHSLLGTQLISRIQGRLGISVPLGELFEWPTVVAFAERLDEVEAHGAVQALTRIDSVDRHGDLDLSFAQERLWFLDHLEPGNAAYNVTLALRLRGELHHEAFERAANALVRRHEVLRTAFPSIDGRPALRIESFEPFELPVENLPSGDPDDNLRRFVQRERDRPFDLSRGPLFRCRLLAIGETEHVVVFTVHHIVTDAWSMGLMLHEMASHYGAYRERQPSLLPELALQYADYAVWQRQWLRGEVLGKQLAYWRAQMDGVSEALELPFDRPRNLGAGQRGAGHRLRLPPVLIDGLSAVVGDQYTLFMTLMAVFQIQLGRYAGQRDFCVGTPVAGRSREEVEGMLGFFVNTLALRADLSDQPSFNTVLERTRATVLGAQEHQELPFEKLVDELEVERDLGRSPLFQVLLALGNVPWEEVELPSLEVSPVAVDTETAKFDLALTLAEDAEGGVGGQLRYRTDLFDAVTIERWAGHFERLLCAVMAEPDRPIWELPLLDEAERQQIVSASTRRRESPTQETLIDLFRASQANRGAAPAVEFEGEVWSYDALAHRAHQLSHLLRAEGAGPGMRIGLCVGRTLSVPLGILGILGTGAAYLPLDPSYPAARRTWMLEDAGATLVVTDSASRSDFEGVSEAWTLIDLDRDQQRLAQQPTQAPTVELPASAPAYVIYTSGSTGTPKGVPVSHANVVRLLRATEDVFDFGADDVWTLFHAYAFDFSVWELWGALAYGGRVAVVSWEASRSPETFASLLRDAGVTVLCQTPSAFRQLVALADAGDMDRGALRWVIFGGEALVLQDLAPWFERFGDQQPALVNMYGITETTVHVTHRRITHDDLRVRQGSRIGQAIADLDLFVLDTRMELQPWGIRGELFVGGAGLSSGYLGRPALTAERFLPNPWAEHPGDRLYRTGDLARIAATGDLEYQGRADHQVKVRGFRIELGEIESELKALASVGDAAVLLDEGEHKALVAYVVPSGDVPEVSELRTALAQSLPGHMIPNAFVVLEALPLTPNGKLDRRALRRHQGEALGSATEFVAPRDPREESLADIWREVLGLEQVGVHDNFFELGGDSILSLQIVARARKVGIDLRPRDMFVHQTVAELVLASGRHEAIQAEQGPVTGPVEITPIIQRWIDTCRHDPHHHNQAVLLEVDSGLGHLLPPMVETLIQHHDCLRLRLVKVPLGWRMVIAPPEDEIPLTRIDLSDVAAERRPEALAEICAETQTSLDPARGPILRFVHVDYGPEEPGRFLMVIHHLAVDGVSWRILLGDLELAFEQLSAGEPIELPPKTTSFQQWAQRVQRLARSEHMLDELEYWTSDERRSVEQIPVDRPEGSNRVVDIDTVHLELGQDETLTLLQELPRTFRTEINDVLLTALLRAYHRWTGQGSLLFDLEHHGRVDLADDIDVSRTVGWFTSLFPVHLGGGDTARIADSLAQVKESLRRIPRDGFGYGVLRHMGDRAASQALADMPEARILFNHHGRLGRDDVLEDTPIQLAWEDPGPRRSGLDVRTHLLDVTTRVDGDILRLSCDYSREQYDRSTIEAWMEAFQDALRDLVKAVDDDDVHLAAADFPLADTEPEELADLLAEVEFE